MYACVSRLAEPCLILALLTFAGNVEAGAKFNESRAWSDLIRIVGFGPRPSGSAQSDKTLRYIVAELRKAGVKTWAQEFVAATSLGAVRMKNVVGEIAGEKSDIILIGGHYDTKYYPSFRFVGANDGGSSTALLIELARCLVRTRPQYTIWIAFFDGEEERDPNSNSGASYGANHMVNQLIKGGDINRVRATIVVDMIADRDLDIPRDHNSSAWLTEILWSHAKKLGLGNNFLDNSIAIEDDHVPFLRAGIPSTLLIDYNYGGPAGGGGYWHTAEDTLDKLSSKSLKKVGDVILSSIPTLELRLNRRNGKRFPK